MRSSNHIRLLVMLGATFWIGWNVYFLLLSPGSSVIVPNPASPYAQIGFVLGNCLGAGLFVALGRAAMSRWYASRLFAVSVVACGLAGAVCFLSQQIAPSPPVAGLVILGALSTVLTTAWMNALGKLRTNTFYEGMGKTTAAGILVALLLDLTDGSLVGALLGILFQAASLFCLFMVRCQSSSAVSPAKDHSKAAIGGRFSLPGKVLLFGALFYAAIGFVIAVHARVLPVEMIPSISLWESAGMVLAACGFVAFGRRARGKQSVGVVPLYVVIGLIIVGLFMLQTALPYAVQIMDLMIAGGCILLHLYAKTLYLDIAARSHDLTLSVFFQTTFVNFAAGLLGAALSFVVPLGLLNQPWISLISLMVSVILVACMLLCFSPADVASCWGLSEEGPAAEGSETEGAVSGRKAQYVLALDRVADEGGLTPREREVFARLARGQRAGQIKAELSISIGTVRNHVNHIYTKLGVHNYGELKALVDSRYEQLKSEEV